MSILFGPHSRIYFFLRERERKGEGGRKGRRERERKGEGGKKGRRERERERETLM